MTPASRRGRRLVEHGIRVAPLAERVEAGHDRRPPLLGVGLDVRRAQCVGDSPAASRDLDRLGAEPVAVRASRRRSSSSRASRAASARDAESEGRSSSQRIVFENAKPAEDRVHLLREHLGERPARRPRRRGTRRAPRARPTETPCRFAKPAAALSRIATGGPFTHWSGVRSGTSSASTASRRGVTRTCVASTPERAACELGQLALGLPAGGRRQLLAADLNQERRHRLPHRAVRSCARACGRGRCRRPAR